MGAIICGNCKTVFSNLVAACPVCDKPVKEAQLKSIPKVSSIKTIEVIERDWVSFQQLFSDQEKWGNTIALSCNQYELRWPSKGYGYTPEDFREDLKSHPLTKPLLAAALEVRPEGGRIFVERSGAYYKPDKDRVPIVNFIIVPTP